MGNETTGNVCWWELYSVSETQGYNDTRGLTRTVKLEGNDRDNYFASMPFVVDMMMRLGERNYTWRSGEGSDNRASSTTVVAGNRPTGNAAPGMYGEMKDGGGVVFAVVSVLRGVIGLLTFMV